MNDWNVFVVLAGASFCSLRIFMQKYSYPCSIGSRWKEDDFSERMFHSCSLHSFVFVHCNLMNSINVIQVFQLVCLLHLCKATIEGILHHPQQLIQLHVLRVLFNLFELFSLMHIWIFRLLRQFYFIVWNLQQQ